MGEETRQDPRANYDYLDDLDNRGWAWEFLRRCDKYQSDYLSIQNLEHPEPFDSEHKALAEKWYLRRMMDPCSLKSPEFFYERYENIDDLMLSDPIKWGDLWLEMKPPVFSNDVGKRSLICWDLRARKYSNNKIAELLHPDHMGISQDPGNQPGIDLVKYAFKRFKQLQADYIKITYSP